MSDRPTKLIANAGICLLSLLAGPFLKAQRAQSPSTNETTKSTKTVAIQKQATDPILIDFEAASKKVSPTMWGIFFEDINFAADGGIYAELVKNRSFELPSPMMGWRQLRTDKGSNADPARDFNGKILITERGTKEVDVQKWGGNHHYAAITVDNLFGLQNEGFRGMGFKKGAPYRFTGQFRTQSSLQVLINLLDSTHKIVASSGWTQLPQQQNWGSFEKIITPTATVAKGVLEIQFKGKGQVDADMLSLFPVHTWKNRPGGLRADIVQQLADLHPGFIRFPGGCIVEGRTLANRYQWKNTVGPVDKRVGIMNRWNEEFRAPRNAPDYYQSFGLGFFEYFQLAEDIGAQPLPILNCGMACQYNSGEVAADIDPYIQDALDLIEFANGDIQTPFGKLRAEMGHPAPFNLKFLGIGNEQWDTQYFDRYKEFAKVLSAKHPEIQLVSGSGPSSDGKWFDMAWEKLRVLKPALIDEHYYKPPEWFLANANRYDHYDRKGPKVFAGEYAAHGKMNERPESGNSWYSALTEAAFMTGLERNADVVQMASYAPLLAHIDAWQWRPDLIWFDNLNTMATPNYYVQQLFSKAKGTSVIQTTNNGEALIGQDSLYASTTLDSASGKIYIKLVNVASRLKKVTLSLKGQKIVDNAEGIWELITADALYDFNSLANPDAIRPIYINFGAKVKKMNQKLSINSALPAILQKGKLISMELPATSVNLIELPIR